MTARPKISVLIVFYNSASYVLDCLGSLQQHIRTVDYEILAIDNGSDGSGEIAKQHYPCIDLRAAIGNVGFGAANNYLSDHAGGEYLLLINPDTKLGDDAIDRLVEFAENNSDIDAFGGRTVTRDGQFDAGNRIAFPTISALMREALGIGVRNDGLRSAPDIVEPYPVDVLCGGFMLIRRSIWDRLGGFDPSFFLYYEEVDLFARLARLGGKAWVKPDCIITHDVGSGDVFDPRRILSQLTGRMHYLRKHCSRPETAFGFVLTWLSSLRRYLQAALLGRFSARYRGRRLAYREAILKPGRWRHGYRSAE